MLFARSIPFIDQVNKNGRDFSAVFYYSYFALGPPIYLGLVRAQRILASPILGRIADKCSFATSMTIGFLLAGLGFLSMVFTMPNTRWLYLAYACLYGFSMAAINSGVINLVYDYVEHDDRACAMGVKNALGGILAFFTALLSGLIMSKIQENGGLHIGGATVYAQQVLSLLSVIAVIALVIYMRLVIAPLTKVDDTKNADNNN